MAVALELLDIIVPIATIKAKYPGGWAQCLADHADILGDTVWYDAHLFHDSAMDIRVAEAIVKQWQAKGVQLTAARGGETVWQDVCVVEPETLEPTRPCDWLAIDKANRCAYMVGQAQGVTVSREDFVEGI